jgi:hypothetical protein
MIHEQSFHAAAELRKPPGSAAEKNNVSDILFIGILALLLAIGVSAWTSYDYWSAPVMGWLGSDNSRNGAGLLPPERTDEQQMLIDVTEGKLAEIVVTGEDAESANAALPFSDQPIASAKPFRFLTSSLDAQRAQTCLTQAIYYEAGFEPLAGKRAVAQVVLNRMRHPAFPSSVCGVVYQGYRARVCQFSFTCDGALHRRPQDAAWAESRRIAAAALAGYVEPKVGTSTHYHADYVSPYWAPKLSKIAKLGAHIFYSWPGAWGRRAAFSSRYAGGEFVPPLSAIGIAQSEADMGQVPDFASTGLSVPPSIKDRHAETDVGGRLDVSKGWILKIPDPSETRGSFGKLTSRQADAPGSSNPAETGIGQ